MYILWVLLEALLAWACHELSLSPKQKPLDKGSVALVVGVMGFAVVLLVFAFVLLSRS